MANNTNNHLETKIKLALDSIRPYLQTDGGDITFVELTDDNIVKVKLLGACNSCPMSIQTLKLGVEKAVQNAVPEVKEVIAINDDMENMFPEDF
ncbi:MAG: NifU family protein [Bacteroidetes bacterium]|nr:MAG: NifU family protein [Bacteroidota bacterium]